jgi:3-oxoacyl-[acyl-carrier protein] reductase
LAEAGCEVVVNGRSAEALEATISAMRSATGVKVAGVQADVATPEGQAALFRACPEPDILINNNAGPPPRDFRELTREQILEGVTANMVVAIELIQKAMEPMTRNKFGRIVNITSGTVKLPQATLDLSSGARGGLSIFIAGVARQVADKNVTINSLLPGAFNTERLKATLTGVAKRRGIDLEQATAERIASIPARRIGDPAEFGAACAFLCSAQAGFITGQNMLIDGGAFPGAF